LIWLVIAAVFIVPWAWNLLSGRIDRIQISYSTFRQQVQAGNVEQVTVAGQKIQGQLKEPAEKELTEDKSVQYTDFVTYLPSFGDEELLSLLEKHGVEIETEPETGFSWWSLVLNFLPIVLLFGVGYLVFSRMQA
jgi:cell division protease FtsH